MALIIRYPNLGPPPVTDLAWLQFGSKLALDGNPQTLISSDILESKYQTGKANISRSSGKYQFELDFLVQGSATQNVMFGAMRDDVDVSGPGLDRIIGDPTILTDSFGYGSNVTTIWRYLSGVYSFDNVFEAPFVTDTITIGIDLDARQISFYCIGFFEETYAMPTDGSVWVPAVSLRRGASVYLRGANMQFPIPGFTDWGQV